MYILNTDGGARGNPGPAAAAYVLKDDKGNIVKSGGEFLGKTTNNVAEYKALIKGLMEASEFGVKALTCFLDSELIVKQVRGEYRVRDFQLKDLHEHVVLVSKTFDFIKFEHVFREKNTEADKLVNQLLDEAEAR